MLSELSSIEDVMQKLGRVTTNPDLLPDTAMEQVIDDAAASYEITGSGSSLSLATPTSSAMGSRQSSMSSIASINSASASQHSSIRQPQSSENEPMSPSRSSVTSVDSLSRHRSFNQYDFASLRRGQKNGFSSASYNGGDSYMASERPNSALSSSVSLMVNGHGVGYWHYSQFRFQKCAFIIKLHMG